MPKYYIEGFDLRKKPTTTRLFLAEGLSEVGLLEAALRVRDANPEIVTILCFQGVNKMSGHSRTIAKLIGPEKLSGLQAIGIVADSENDPSARIDVIIECGKAFCFPRCATDLRNSGQHVSDGRKLAMSLSPAPASQGRIEDLILLEISQRKR